MRIIDRYICREVLSHALLGLTVFTFVLFVPQLVRLMELIVRHSADAGTVALLFLSTLPGVLTFSVPMAVLVGVLIGLGRLSADSETIALQALGMGLRRLLLPVGVLALGTATLTLAMTSWLGPAGVRALRALEDHLRATQASFQVQPRVFDERFPHLVLYVHDIAAAATRWRGIFLAESGAENSSRLTLAEEAIVVADPEQGKLQLHLREGSTHEYSRSEPARYSVTTFGESDLPVAVGELAGSRAAQVSNAERATLALLRVEGPGWLDARVEFHRRLAFPAACLVFALVAVPVGARPRRGGRAAGFVVTLLLLCAYYLLFVTGAGMARSGKLSPGFGIWAANVLTAIAGLALLPHLEHIRGEGYVAHWAAALAAWRNRKPPLPAAEPAASGSNGPTGAPTIPVPTRRGRSTGFPLLMDLHVLRSFFFYFVSLLLAFLLLFEAFTFFELLEDIARHRIPYGAVANYFRYLTPQLLYMLVPLAALVGALVTLGVMTKNNEITAFKASGVSLYRVSLPLLVAGVALGVGIFLLDDTYLPYANQRQDALRNEIKGRPAQTFYQPRRQWIFGRQNKVYNYDFFDADHNLFGGLHVFELDPVSFQMRRRVFATRAHWEGTLGTWVLEEGWVRDFQGPSVSEYVPFLVYSLAELNESPAYFKREVRQSFQMNWRELRQYIGDLRQAGFDVARLSVQWHKKFAFPLIAPIIVLLGIPFAFLVGTRGAVGGLALGVGIAIAYWASSALFEAMGAVGQLPPFLAGWAPDAIFGFLGLYFFLKMPT